MQRIDIKHRVGTVGGAQAQVFYGEEGATGCSGYAAGIIHVRDDLVAIRRPRITGAVLQLSGVGAQTSEQGAEAGREACLAAVDGVIACTRVDLITTLPGLDAVIAGSGIDPIPIGKHRRCSGKCVRIHHVTEFGATDIVHAIGLRTSPEICSQSLR